MVDLYRFPDVDTASKDGLLAMGGDLSPSMLVSAYAQGIFPWFNQGQPILWWSPDPRMVLFPSEFKLSRSLRKTVRKHLYRVTANQQFVNVINACALRGNPPNQAEQETWITREMQQAYTELHHLGYAHSIEIWRDDTLVGGLYGLLLNHVFFGESMFSNERDTSKIALFSLTRWLQHRGVKLIDCQVSSPHLASLGAREIARTDFLHQLDEVDIHQANKNYFDGFEQFLTQNVITTL
ncbi:leucyl/phenylalanyl-tRNA--protein transferase [Arenicella chitinivorans]|uniref:Leucyl/phenylalanyl-tRNA--protein transferase n=1 Tax=Arenicella chitinivorans TaxID=1329800 RepID=A0A918RYG2_9GAMM|nr:leucyl/phenylalanyl-tRNA--protein transferase [Arenicella chitinivorans]GHA17252.1 leucyl/phenylalanyl-tRNA--protein transferase [Arenicella chitinivorans]